MGIVTVLPTVRSQSLALKRKFDTQAQRPRAESGLHPALMRFTQEDKNLANAVAACLHSTHHPYSHPQIVLALPYMQNTSTPSS